MMNKIFFILILTGLMIFSPVISKDKPANIWLTDLDGNKHEIIKESFAQPIILIRYLGATCSKCLHQLNLLNAISDTLKKQNIKVIGFSNDDAVQCRKILKQVKYENSAVSLYSDSDSKISELIGATIIEITGEKTELHATMLIYKGEILFSDIDAKPFMKISKIFDLAVAAKKK